MTNEPKHMEQGLEFDAQLTKRPENVTCENLSNADEISLKNWVFAWAADVKGIPLDSDINDLIWVIEKHIKEQAALQSPRVPVIKWLDEAIKVAEKYRESNCEDISGLLIYKSKYGFYPHIAIEKAARAYAELQKGN
jgi:hypothetical protein